MNLSHVNFPLYFLGVFLAGPLSYTFKDENLPQTDLKSFQWVAAIRRTNYQVIVLSLVLFAIVFTTKDKAISRLLIGSFIASVWLLAVPVNRYVPEWIAGIAFRGNNSVRTVFLGSAKSARRLELWAERQPFFGIDILGLITYEMAIDLQLRMPILGEFIDMSLIIDAYKVD